MKFIKLTFAGAKTTVLVNISTITHIYPESNGNTTICHSENNCYPVSESFEDIIRVINALSQ